MNSSRRAGLIVGCLALGIVGYYLPWFAHSTAGFTMNGFDLAEWSSLHPAVRSSSPPMLTSFLLRLPQVVLAAALALAANGLLDPRRRWVARGAAVLLALRMVPPTDFFGSARGDPNYRQMAFLTVAGLALVLGALGLYRLSPRWQKWLLAALLVSGLLAGWVGLSRAGTLLENFEIDVHPGAGIILWSAASGAAMLLVLWPESGPLRNRAAGRAGMGHKGS